MSKKKIFTLMRGDHVHIAPEVEFIPAAEFSELTDALSIKQRVQEDAEEYKMQIADECEQLKALAAQEGFAKGFEAWVEMIAHQETETAKVRAEMQKVIAPVALKAAKKIVGREIELSEDTVVDIISNSLKSVATHKKIIIYVNKKDLRALEANKPKLRALFEDLETLSIQEHADVEPGGARIVTDKGLINAQLENQWRILEQVLGKLFKASAVQNSEIKEAL